MSEGDRNYVPTDWAFVEAARLEFRALWQEARSLTPKQETELREAMQDIMIGAPRSVVILPRDDRPVAIVAPYVRKALLLLRTIRKEEERANADAAAGTVAA